MLKFDRLTALLSLALVLGAAPAYAASPAVPTLRLEQTTTTTTQTPAETPATTEAEAADDTESMVMISYFSSQPGDDSEAISELEISGSDPFSLADLDVKGARFLRLSYMSGGETQSKVYRILVAPSTGRIFVITSEGIQDLRVFLTNRGLEFDDEGMVMFSGDFNLDVEGIG